MIFKQPKGSNLMCAAFPYTCDIEFFQFDHAKDFELPKYATHRAAGMDLQAAIETQTLILPQETALIPTGYGAVISEGWELQIRSRSGIGHKKRIVVTLGVGTIDADYRGELMISLTNFGHNGFLVKRGDRIAQLVLSPAPQGNRRKFTGSYEEFQATSQRGIGGFGSTGI